MEGIIQAFQASAQLLWVGVVENSPKIVAALLILFFGTLLAATLGLLVARFARLIQLDRVAEQLRLHRAAGTVGVKNFQFSKLIGWLVKWFFVLVVFIAAADVLGWPAVTEFLTDVTLYVPKVLVAVLILLAGTALANFVNEVIRRGVKATQLAHPGMLGTLAKWLILIFAVMAALVQLEIAADMIQILFTGLVAMLALAGGLAFGLGGKDAAKDLLQKIKREID